MKIREFKRRYLLQNDRDKLRSIESMSAISYEEFIVRHCEDSMTTKQIKDVWREFKELLNWMKENKILA